MTRIINPDNPDNPDNPNNPNNSNNSNNRNNTQLQQQPNKKTLPSLTGAISFQNVSFSYPSRPTKPIFKDINLEVTVLCD